MRLCQVFQETAEIHATLSSPTVDLLFLQVTTIMIEGEREREREREEEEREEGKRDEDDKTGDKVACMCELILNLHILKHSSCTRGGVDGTSYHWSANLFCQTPTL